MKRLIVKQAPHIRVFTSGSIYLLLLCAAYWVAWELRFDFVVPANLAPDRALGLLPVVSVQLLVLLGFRQFGSMLSYFSLPDLLRIVIGLTLASLIIFASAPFAKAHGYVLPRSVMLANLMLSVGFLCAFRVALRVYREQTSSSRGGADKTPGGLRVPVVIIGAGDVGANLAKELVGGRHLGLLPVAFLDDDLKKRGSFVHGIPVVGTLAEIAKARARYEFDRVIIAMPSAPEKRLREVVQLMSAEGLSVDIVPSMGDLASGRLTVTRIRPVDVTDLLGRKSAQLDAQAIRDSLTDRVVMVTGAGGSIGSELCRQIAACNPTRLLLIERSEAALFVIEQELINAGLGAIIQPLVADIADRSRMRQIFARYRPRAVFHAAAHKHVFLMERQPSEAIRNNSLGTLALAEEAVAHDVDEFVFISTDKAINPTNVMGASKRLAELLLRQLHLSGATGKTKIMAVRFGNVLGSSGSVVPIFRQQIAKGGPVTVTHPDVTRYFMTIPEAVGLVLQASLLGTGGEIFVLDMGPPVKIADLARQMIQLSGFEPDVDIEIVYSGLKPGEKLFEELQHHTEQHKATNHPQIMKFVADEAELSKLTAAVREAEPTFTRMETNDLKRWLNKLIGEYKPFLD